MIDLHMHSTASDGTYSPAALVRLAKAEGLRTIALTDHDTVDGVGEAMAEGEAIGVEVIPGVEISVTHGGGEMHILGYGLDIDHPGLLEGLEQLRAYRDQRNPLMIEKLQGLGIPITLEEVEGVAKGQVVGRPHFAAVLVQKGVVSSVSEAFERFLAAGKEAYVPKERLTPREGIHLIRQAGGIPVLAHPVFLKESGDPGSLKDLLKLLRKDGLQGVEVYYTDHTPEQIKQYQRLADELGLIVTGGSDFHGENRPQCRLGRGTGRLHVPPQVLEGLARKG